MAESTKDLEFPTVEETGAPSFLTIVDRGKSEGKLESPEVEGNTFVHVQEEGVGISESTEPRSYMGSYIPDWFMEDNVPQCIRELYEFRSKKRQDRKEAK